jgi:hypothetical protein
LAGGLAARGSAGVIGGSRVVAVLSRAGLAGLVAVAFSLPLRCFEIYSFIDYHRRQLPALPSMGEGMISVACIDPWQGYFRSDLVRNDPFLESGPYVFVSQGRSNDERNIATIARRFGLECRKLSESGPDSTWVLFGEPASRPPAAASGH